MREIEEEKRPKPESFLDLIRQEGRGNLKIFLGFAPGVGKTYRMLQEAHQLKQKGVDVVVGIVDAHGRKDTEKLLEGLEQIPPRKVNYKGHELLDMDMDAVLMRLPELVIIDELAHTNAPGGHNEKRWQDVEECLAMGINAMTTMNVQHIESLNDDIARTTKVRVTETVPDRFLSELADEIVDVDLPVDELLGRLEEGKIYPRDSVATALRNFFQSHKLTALRELSLREVAKSVGARGAKKESTLSEESRGEVPKERVLVAISLNHTNASMLIRKGARLAGELNTDWDVIYVESPKDNEQTRTIQESQRLHDNMDLARSLSAKTVRIKGQTITHEILKYARENRIGKIVIGKAYHPWYTRLFREDIMGHILRESGPIDVYVVSFEKPKRSHLRFTPY
ncbi:MAG TPA: histidine kinase [Candidatus Thermoplasmatota archaeon]|nr:histidine kinase [Candidatus Thermoplasmatota archaeon]